MDGAAGAGSGGSAGGGWVKASTLVPRPATLSMVSGVGSIVDA
jgi:hypothetical protein